VPGPSSAATGGTATDGAADRAAPTGTRVATTTSGTWPLADASGTAALIDADADAGGRDSGPAGLERARPLPACGSASTRDRVEVKSVPTTVDGTSASEGAPVAPGVVRDGLAPRAARLGEPAALRVTLAESGEADGDPVSVVSAAAVPAAWGPASDNPRTKAAAPIRTPMPTTGISHPTPT